MFGIIEEDIGYLAHDAGRDAAVDGLFHKFGEGLELETGG
jgi:hypothetical protein